MNRLIIIGNGFDLAHGMKSSYGDFMDWYWRRVVNRISGAPYHSMYKDDLIHLEENKQARLPNTEQAANKIIEILRKEFTHFEFKSYFFDNLCSQGIDMQRWVDIELFYYKELKILLRGYKPNSHTNDPGFDEAINDLNQGMSAIKQLFAEYIAEAEKVLFMNKPYSSIFSQYLNFFNYGKFETIRPGVAADKFDKTAILNFNYTTLAHDYYGRTSIDEDDEPIYIPIHGNLKSPSTMIFGFGDELDEDYLAMERANDNRFFQHVKSFGYFRDIEYNKLDIFLDVNEPFRVDVLGHSLGLSDRTLLSQIFENPNLQEVNLCYHRSAEGYNDYTEKTYELSRHFSNKTRMRKVVRKFRFCEPMPQIENQN